LNELCRRYYYPVYAEIRHAGHDADAARDLTQGFFVHLLEKSVLKVADPDRGRFRAFLKASIHNFLSNERDRVRTLKRGGGVPLLPLELAESRYVAEAGRPETPESSFEARWAQQILSLTLDRLRAEYREPAAAARYRCLEPFITGQHSSTSDREVARDLEVTESAVRMKVHRLRKRFGTLLRAEVADTVSDPQEVDEELQHLFSALT